MEAYDSMKNRLLPTGLYTLSGGTAVDFELKAYAEGLNTAYDMLEELQRESFAATVQSYGLQNLRQAFCISSSVSDEDCRAKALLRGAVAPADLTKNGLTAALAAAGISADVQENADRSLTVKFKDEPACGRDAAQLLLEKIMPAHLSYNSDFSGLT